jgi:RND family efflux transporter MFP subunit
VIRSIAAALATLALLPGCKGAPDAAEEDHDTVPVRVVEVRRVTLEDTARAIGTVRAAETVDLQAEAAGRIEQTHFEEGALVEAGATLFTLRDDALRARRRSLQAALRAARATAERAAQEAARRRPLRESGAVADEEVAATEVEERLARAEVARLRAEMAELEEQLEDTRVVAPFGGRISRRMVDRGSYVRVGDHLATLYRHDALEVVLQVPERLAGRIAPDQAAQVVPAGSPDHAFEARVSYVSPAVEEAGRDLTLKARPVDPAPPGISPGMSVSAELTLEVREGRPVIPAEAVVAQREGPTVFVVEDDRAHQRRVQLGLREPERVEVLEGVRVGERVVREGHLRLSDGARVRVVDGPEATP